MHLVGIAKAAAASSLLEAKRKVDYRELATQKWINRVPAGRHSFNWSINPYRGCEMACAYCYARYTHEFMELREPADFETRIFSKQWNPAAFRAELAAIPRSEAIALGTATDPYQAAERRFQLTRKILTEFARDAGRRIWITTKSDLPARDLDLLEAVSRRHILLVNFTITTLDAQLARQWEPGAPRPDLRLRALQQLSARGIACGVIASPIAPQLNDDEADLLRLAEAAKQAGARWFGGGSLFLKSPTKEVFLSFLAQQHLDLLPTYAAQFGTHARLSPQQQQTIEARLERVRQATQLSRKAVWSVPEEFESGRQLALFG
ncbi:MAG: PA0069 family radical SAM protein [Bryobacter sp.]